MNLSTCSCRIPSLVSVNIHSVFLIVSYSPLPPSDWKCLLLHFSLMPTSNKHHMFTFLKLLQLKETRFYHHTFLFFYEMTSLSLTLRNKNLKTFPKKCFGSQDGWEKTSYPGISAEGYRWKHEVEVASKKGVLTISAESAIWHETWYG